MAIGQQQGGNEAVSLEKLANAISAAMPRRMDATDQRIAAGLYRGLAEGQRVSPEAISRTTSIPVNRINAALDSWPGVHRDEEGCVIGFWGLTVRKMDPEYRFQIDGNTSYAWCALDTLFIPAFLGKDVAVEATCPVTGEPVSFVVAEDGVHELRPVGAVVSMVSPNQPFGYDVIESFCHRVHFFATQDAGARWAAEHEGTTLLSAEEAFELGRAMSKRIAPDLFGAWNQTGPHNRAARRS